MILSALKYWLPYKLIHEQEQILCRWFYANEKRFTEPFFDETIQKCLSHPYNSKRFKCVSNIELLPQWAEGLEFIQPTAFLFHISRCGSTLVSQLLSQSEQNIVLSEVPLLDELLRMPYKNNKVDVNGADKLFAAALYFYSRKRSAAERHLFIKTDSWHILFYSRLRRIYPDVPFILLYRRPDEVIRSHQRMRGIHAVPGILEPDLFGFRSEEIKDDSLDTYLAKVLVKYYSAYLEVIHSDTRFVLVNYSEGFMSIMNKIVGKTGIDFSEAERQKMKDRITFDAKNPEQRFSEHYTINEVPLYLYQCFELYQQLEDYRSSLK